MKAPQPEHQTAQPQRERFSSSLAVFFATLGSAVGLGNIWKFPSMTGQNGGGAFVLVYIISVILVALPVMIGEFIIGRRTGANSIDAFDRLRVKPFWKIIGVFGVISAFAIMVFYSSVAGWVYSYVFKAIRGDFAMIHTLSATDAAANVMQQFDAVAGGISWPVMWQIILLTVVAVILIGGVQKGLERVTKTLMPIFLLLILVCNIWSLRSPGLSQGLTFLFKPDFSKITGGVILEAMGLAFFKLSIGMGTMITYSSYYNKEDKLMSTGARVAFSDIAVSLLIGMIVFPAVFSFGLEPTNGPSLLFNTLPLVFASMPAGNILLVLFFALASIAATTAIISMAEVVVVFMTERFKMQRWVSTLMVVGIVGVLGILTVHPSVLFGGATPPIGIKPLFGHVTFFDFFDQISSLIFMPLGGLLILVLLGFFVNRQVIQDELSNYGALHNRRIIDFYYFIIRFVAPVLVLAVFIYSFIK